MTYVTANRPDNVVAYHSRCWTQISDLVRWITACRRADFTVHSVRTGLLTNLNAIMQEFPRDVDGRFQNHNVLWVCWRDSDWPDKESRLRSLLVSRPTGKGHSQGSSRDGEGQVLSSDAVLGFYKTLEKCLDEIERFDGIYDQARFDQRFGWVANAQ